MSRISLFEGLLSMPKKAAVFRANAGNPAVRRGYSMRSGAT